MDTMDCFDPNEDCRTEGEFIEVVVDSGMILACLIALLITCGGIYGIYELATWLSEVL